MENSTLHRLDWHLLSMGEHCYLDSSDECYFVDVYECRCGSGNKPLVVRVKRSLDSALCAAAEAIDRVLPEAWRYHHTFVPMPPSRGLRGATAEIVQRLSVGDARSLLLPRYDTPSSHQGWRPDPTYRSALLRIDEQQALPDPNAIVVVDDVLTTGSHFRAAKAVLGRRWPGVRVVGLFLSRTCWRGCSVCARHPAPSNATAEKDQSTTL